MGPVCETLYRNVYESIEETYTRYRSDVLALQKQSTESKSVVDTQSQLVYLVGTVSCHLFVYTYTNTIQPTRTHTDASCFQGLGMCFLCTYVCVFDL